MPTLWIDSLLSEAVSGGGRDLVILGATGLATLELRMARFTLTRTIIGLDIHPTVPDSGEGDQVVDIGIGLGSIEQSLVADFSDPSVETDFPTTGWLWRARYRVYAVAAGDQNRAGHVRVDLDIRGQRKLQNGRMLLTTTNQDNQGVSTAITLTGIIRQLFIVG